MLPYALFSSNEAKRHCPHCKRTGTLPPIGEAASLVAKLAVVVEAVSVAAKAVKPASVVVNSRWKSAAVELLQAGKFRFYPVVWLNLGEKRG